MKTTCPGCATTFRVTEEQLAVRAGKVRCGKCQAVFDANAHLQDKETQPTASAMTAPAPLPAEDAPVPPPKTTTPDLAPIDFFPPEPAVPLASVDTPETITLPPPAESPAPSSPLKLPRETTEVPGYSKWAEGAINPSANPFASKASHWPFLAVAALLGLVLGGQMLFHFRSQVVIAVPDLRPLIESLSDMMGADIPLPRYAELIAIESSDLQADPGRADLLALQATLRNRAPHDQGYPALQLSLTDTQDNVIARRVFLPGEYLPPQNLTPLVFAANAELPVRLWIEAREITAAGYRLYAFYP